MVIDPSRVRFTFAALSPCALSHSELIRTIEQHLPGWMSAQQAARESNEWELPSPSARAALKVLLDRRVLRQEVLPFPHRKDQVYVLGEVSLYDVVQATNRSGYFSHLSGLYLNQLTEQIPKTFYFNVEQRATGGGASLTQEAIHRAFKGRPRETSNVVEHKGTRICKLNGRNTDQLGVINSDIDEAVRPLRVSNVERTLIDATVRPNYSGGVAVVARAFEAAKDRLSVNKLTAYLKKLSYTYPYHQAIGFYLDRAGVEETRLSLLRRLPMDFDFYLTYGMRSTDYIERWRLFVPKGF